MNPRTQPTPEKHSSPRTRFVSWQWALAYIKGAPLLMRKLDEKASARCGLPVGSGIPKAFAELTGALQRRSAETVGVYIPDPDPFWREHREAA